MSEIDFEAKFPQMEPIKRPPSLRTINGIGLTLYGRRNEDPETGTYVKTTCFSLVFVPVFWLRSYRVADAEQGWFFLGREPMSGFAKAWNFVVFVLMAAAFGNITLQGYYNSPSKVAERQLAEARGHAEAGRDVQAARVYLEVAQRGTSLSVEGEKGFDDLFSRALSDGPPAKVAKYLKLADRHAGSFRESVLARAIEPGFTLISSNQETDAAGCLELLAALASHVDATVDLAPQREALLERVVALEPDNPTPASSLAVMLEERGALERLEEILTPHAERLGELEGARILGQIRAAQGDFESSRALLLPYTTGRLERLTAARTRYDKVMEAAWSSEIDRLENSIAPQDWYNRYNAADETEQASMVQDWVGPRAQEDARVIAAADVLQREAEIVPVALNLGIVMVRRAQRLQEPDERRAELEAAEKVFLGIQGFASESDEFRLSLGRVNYWLGRPDDGSKLFDEVLEANERSTASLLGVAHALREVGMPSKARALSEEAWESAPDKESKETAANVRSLLFTDNRDRLTWLERSSGTLPEVRASLLSTRASIARQEGRRDEAVRQYRESIAVYAKMSRTPATLNNQALVQFQLHDLTDDRDAFRVGAELMEQAVAFMPGDPILLSNAASPLAELAAMDAIGDALDLTVLPGPARQMLSFCYADEPSRREILSRFHSHEALKKARGFLESVLVLSPNAPATYGRLVMVLQGGDDEVSVLKDLLERVKVVELDVADNVQSALDHFAGEKIEEEREAYRSTIAEMEASVKKASKANDRTRAVASAMAGGARLAASSVGIEVDLDGTVDLARRAHREVDSPGTRGLLQAVFLRRAVLDLAGRSQAWADLLRDYDRSLTATYIVATVLVAGGPLATEALANEDIQSTIELVSEELDRFPDTPSAWDWAMLLRADAEKARLVARKLEQEEVLQLRSQLELRLQPASGISACRSYFLALAGGRPGEARAAVDAAAALGVPLPMDLLQGG